MDLDKPLPQKSLNLTPDQDNFIKSFEQVISPQNDLPLAIIPTPLDTASSSTQTTQPAITPEDVERVLLGVNNKIKEFHQSLPSLSVAPSEVFSECDALSKMCKQMLMDYSLQYEQDYIINIARRKFIQDKVEAKRLEAQRLYDERMKAVLAEVEDQLSTIYTQEMQKMLQVETESTECV
jgi:hypothetical protein